MMLAMMQNLMTFAFPIVGSIMLCYGIFQIVLESRASSHKKVQERLKGGSGKRQQDLVKQSILKRPGVGQSNSLGDLLLGRLSLMKKVQGMLDQADLEWSASTMMLNLGALALAALVALPTFDVSLLASVGCSVSVLLLPFAYLSFRRKRRIKKLTNQLPDVFEMMSQALRAGHSLGSAIQLIHEQMPNPIAAEFGRVYHEQNLGIKIEDALVDMAERLDVLDVKFFVTAVLIQRTTGGDLAEVIDNIGSVIRSRIELFGLVAGLTAEGRLSGWVLFALPFIVFAATLYMNPAYGNVLLEDESGKLMLMGAAGLQVMGIAMIRWIVNIKV